MLLPPIVDLNALDAYKEGGSVFHGGAGFATANSAPYSRRRVQRGESCDT